MATQSTFTVFNGTTGPELNTTMASSDILSAILPSTLLALLPAVMSSSYLQDWVKLALIGGILETARRFSSTAWERLVDTCFVEARVEKGDDAYDWLMFYFAKHPAFSNTRKVCVSTKQREAKGSIDDCYCPSCMASRPPKEDLPKRLSYLPTYNFSYYFFFEYTLISVLRTHASIITSDGNGATDWLDLKILTLGYGKRRSVITNLLTVAKEAFDKEEENRISVYVTDQYANWRRAGSKNKRPWSSIVLEDGVKEMLLTDANDFMQSQAWYSDRGIPYRRGYLLHGVPGSGKTSLIQALAGELGLDIYVISLAKRSLDDSGLNDIITSLPPSCIALMEDIDCAFRKGVTSRDSDSDDSDTSKDKDSDEWRSPFGITLSGLLNAIDGIAAHEGRLLFATTNVPDSLDPALTRPGRMDVTIEFKNASQRQAEDLFKCFFPATALARKEEPTEKDALLHDDDCAHSEVSSPMPATITTSNPHGITTPLLSLPTRDALATCFASSVPSREFSMASLQGYLMQRKASPWRCADEIGAWVELELEAARERARKKEEAERRREEVKKREEKKAEEEKEKEKMKEKEKEKTKEASKSAETQTDTTKD